MIRRPAGNFGRNPIEPQFREVEFVNEGIDCPNWIVLLDPVLQVSGNSVPFSRGDRFRPA
jgi:hypothetical protein